jgi:hypothetical protein
MKRDTTGFPFCDGSRRFLKNNNVFVNEHPQSDGFCTLNSLLFQKQLRTLRRSEKVLLRFFTPKPPRHETARLTFERLRPLSFVGRCPT